MRKPKKDPQPQEIHQLNDEEMSLMQMRAYPHPSYLHRVINVSCSAYKSQKDLMDFYKAIDDVMAASSDTQFQGALMNFAAIAGKFRGAYLDIVMAEQAELVRNFTELVKKANGDLEGSK